LAVVALALDKLDQRTESGRPRFAKKFRRGVRRKDYDNSPINPEESLPRLHHEVSTDSTDYCHATIHSRRASG
jgi:hypothetical protein